MPPQHNTHQTNHRHTTSVYVTATVCCLSPLRTGLLDEQGQPVPGAATAAGKAMPHAAQMMAQMMAAQQQGA